jgi:nucleoside-diphosphate-sugar epimerase
VTTREENLRSVLTGDERIAVTGATGWLGSSALELLDRVLGPTEAAIRVTAYASSERAGRTRSGRSVDIHRLADLPQQSPAPTHVLHFAYLTRDRLADHPVDEFVAANLAITAVVLEAVASHRPRGIVFASSGAVYNHDRSLTTDLRGNAYGTMKHIDELALRAAAGDVGAAVVIPRIFSLAGAGMTKPDLYALGSLITMARSDGRLLVRSGSPLVRSYVGVDDVVNLSIWLALRGQPAVFDTAGHVVEIADLASLVADLYGLDASSIDRSPATGDPDDIYVGDPTDWTRLTSLAGIEEAPLDELVRQTSEWLGHSGSAKVGSQVPHTDAPGE